MGTRRWRFHPSHQRELIIGKAEGASPSGPATGRGRTHGKGRRECEAPEEGVVRFACASVIIHVARSNVPELLPVVFLCTFVLCVCSTGIDIPRTRPMTLKQYSLFCSVGLSVDV